MATTTLNMVEMDHSDDGTDETSTTDSYMEELELPTKNLDEKILQNNNESKEEIAEDPVKIAEENPEKEEIVEENPEKEEIVEENPEKEEIFENGQPEIETEKEEDEKKSEENVETMSPSSEDMEEYKENDNAKMDMITLPFIAEENYESEKNEYENEDEDDKSEAIKVSISEDVNEIKNKEDDEMKKPKKSRKQEIITMKDVESERGLLPDYDTYEIICQLPIIRRCFIEHNYFKNQLYNGNLYDLDDILRNESSRTLPYENKRLTVIGECLSSESRDSSSDPSDFVQQSTRSSFESEKNYEGFTESDEESNISSEEMVKFQVLKTPSNKSIPILQKPPELIKIGEPVSLEDQDQSVSLDEIDKELSEMENMIKKRGQPIPVLTKIVRSGKGKDINIPMDMPIFKNIKTTDIDEILARVSAMNANNLTIALEREKFKKDGNVTPEDSPKKPEIKVKSVENINEELQKYEFDNRLIVTQGKDFQDNQKKNAVLIPIAPKPDELIKRGGTYYRLVNSGTTSKVFPVAGKDRPIKAPGFVYTVNRPVKKVMSDPHNKPQEIRPVFPVKSIEQKIIPPPSNTRFVRLVPYEPEKSLKKPEVMIKLEPSKKLDVTTKAEKSEKNDFKKHVSLYAFSNILKTILPEGWLVAMDPRYGLQILKTQMDDQLNPSLMVSVVVGRCGKIRINVRGRQLDKSHEIYSNIGSVANSEGKISVFYVLSLIEKLKMYSVCCGCDDASLQKYRTEDGATEFTTEFQKTFRNHSCELLVHLNKKRCYACHRLNEKLKKRQRKDHLDKKEELTKIADLTTNEIKEISEIEKRFDFPPPEKNLKRNLEEESLEESFLSIKRLITDEIEKRRMDIAEKVPKTQEEVLSFMGLTRKDTLEQNSVRKSKREKKNFNKFEPNDINVSQLELEFLEKYWNDINTLFSTSLLFGAYSRTGSGRLQTKCIMFHKILKKWLKIIRDNPDWIGTDLIIYDQTLYQDETAEEIFGNMNIADLRKYLMNAVKEIGKVKCRLKTKNTYFKCLYNKFVKRRAKRQKKEQPEIFVIDNTDDSSREKDEKFFPDRTGNNHEFIMEYVSDGEF